MDVSFINGSHNFTIEPKLAPRPGCQEEKSLSYRPPLIEPVSKYFCGYDDCNQCQKIPFYDQDDSLIKNLIFCRTCEKDPHTLEHYFHETCSREFHVGDKADHERTTFDFSKTEQDARKKFLLQTSYGDINKTKLVTFEVLKDTFRKSQ